MRTRELKKLGGTMQMQKKGVMTAVALAMLVALSTLLPAQAADREANLNGSTVSYTHLTLPTICSV